MAFFGISADDRTNASVPSDADEKGLWDFTHASNSRDQLKGANGAVLLKGAASHPHNSLSAIATDDTELATPADFERLEKCAWLLGQVMNGVAGPVLYNTPSGIGNISEQITYEVTSISGSTVTLKGRHPYAYPFQTIEINGDWIPGQNDRYLFDTDLGAIPVGAEFRFKPPSVLEDKLRPIIKSIDAPTSFGDVDNVTFTVELTNDVSNGMKHIDGNLQDQVDKWYADLFFYRQDAPLPIPDFFSEDFCGFEGKETTFTAEDVGIENRVQLTNKNDDTNVIILKPSHFPDVADGYLGKIEYRTEEGGALESFEEYENRLLTQRVDDSTWKSFIRIGDLFTDFGAYEVVVTAMVSTYSNATDISEVATARTPCACIESRPVEEWEGAGVDGWMCHKASEATGFSDGKFQGQGCWLPDECSHFNPRKTEDSHSSEAIPGKFHMADAVALWDRISVGFGLSLLQRALPPYPPGLIHLYFSISRESGQTESLQSICGTWFGKLPGGKFLSRDPFIGGVLGQRITWSDDDGAHHGLAMGAWYRRDINYDDLFDAASPASAPAGLIPANNTMTLSAESGYVYPPSIGEVDGYILPFMGGVDEYRHSFSSSNFYNRLIRVNSAKRWALSKTVGDTDDDVVDAVGEVAV